MAKQHVKKKVSNPLQILEQYPISSWDWPRVVIFVPQFPALPHADDVFFNFWGVAQQGTPIMQIPYGRTDLVRNRAGLALLQSNYTHVLMLDEDHKHPWDIVQRLCRWVLLDPERLVVGGLNFRRGEPYDPCAFLLGEDERYYPPTHWDKGLIRFDAVGTGSLLISRRVFEIIPPPWFLNDYSMVMEDRWPGEDIGFAKLCRKYGIMQYCDTTTVSPHMIDAYVDETSYRQFLQEHEFVETDIEDFKVAKEYVRDENTR